MPNNIWKNPDNYTGYYWIRAPFQDDFTLVGSNNSYESLSLLLYSHFDDKPFRLGDRAIIMPEDRYLTLIEQDKPRVKKDMPAQPITTTMQVEQIVGILSEQVALSSSLLTFTGKGLEVRENASDLIIHLKGEGDRNKTLTQYYCAVRPQLAETGLIDFWDRIDGWYVNLIRSNDHKAVRPYQINMRYNELRTESKSASIVMGESLYSNEGDKVGERDIAQISSTGMVTWTCRDPFDRHAKEEFLNTGIKQRDMAKAMAKRNGSRERRQLSL